MGTSLPNGFTATSSTDESPKKRAERELPEMEEMKKKIDLTGSFSLLTRDGRRCPSIDALRLLLPPHARSRRRRRSKAARNDGGRRGGDERRGGAAMRRCGAEAADARRRSAARREVWGGGGSPSGSDGAAEKRVRGARAGAARMPVSSPESDRVG